MIDCHFVHYCAFSLDKQITWCCKLVVSYLFLMQVFFFNHLLKSDLSKHQICFDCHFVQYFTFSLYKQITWCFNVVASYLLPMQFLFESPQSTKNKASDEINLKSCFSQMKCPIFSDWLSFCSILYFNPDKQITCHVIYLLRFLFQSLHTM